MKQTVCCVRCGKAAKLWCGHVLAGEKKIIAGWCSKRCQEERGFSGHLEEWMALEKA